MSKNTTTGTRKTPTPAPEQPVTPASSNGSPHSKKTTCPVTAAQFEEVAPNVEVIINGRRYTAEARVFTSGSFGWYLSDKVPVTLTVGDKEVEVKAQTGLNMIVVNSKDAPRE